MIFILYIYIYWYIYIYIWLYIPPFSSSQGAAPPRPPARAGGRAGNPLYRHCFFFTFWGSTCSTLFFNFFEVLEAPGGSSCFFSWNLCRMPSESCLGTPWGPSYEHIWKNIYFWKGWIGLDPWMKRALKSRSNGVFKIQNAWIWVSVMRILL